MDELGRQSVVMCGGMGVDSGGSSSPTPDPKLSRREGRASKPERDFNSPNSKVGPVAHTVRSKPNVIGGLQLAGLDNTTAKWNEEKSNLAV